MQRILLLCLIVVACIRGSAQKNSIKPLTIGDTLPEVAFGTFYPAGSKQIDPKDLAGKLTILDFWNVTCKSCIKGMPKMDSLQRHFGDRVQILLITKDTKKQVDELFAKIKMKRPNLPIVVDDSNYYHKLFPHESDPLHVWVDGNRVIRAITNGGNATISNIQSILNGKAIQLSERVLFHNMDYHKTLLENLEANFIRQIDRYSVWVPNTHKLAIGYSLNYLRDSVTKQPIGIRGVNIPLYRLFVLAYSKAIFGFDDNFQSWTANNRIIVETLHPLDLRPLSEDSLQDEWDKRNLVSYEMKGLKNDTIQLLKTLREDLERYTPFTATIEKKELLCWVVRRTSAIDKIKTKDKNSIPQSEYLNSGLVIRNMPLKNSLIKHLASSYQRFPYPIIDETGYVQNVDLDLSPGWTDMENLKKQLIKYNLYIELAPRKVEVVVIRDKKHSSY